MKNKKILFISMLTTLFLIGCGGNSNKQTIKFDTKEKLGEKLFFDQNLSLTRKTSCATCHDPEHAFIDARFLKEGTDQSVFIDGAFSVGDDDSALGGRNAPTAAYAQFIPTFAKNAKGEYVGGQFHDGRAATLKDQAMGPPLDTAEMMMPNKQSVVERIEENSEYITAFKKLYGEAIFDDINASYEAMGEAIAKFEKTEEFAPFDSKYDRFKQCRDDGNSTVSCFDSDEWTQKEKAGYALFFSEKNTNCASCHSINSKSEAINKEMFTNFKYENIGTPRNKEAMDARVTLGLQDANATFKGLGAFVKNTDTDWKAHLGKSKVPTLRNVAVTGPYMSNGVFEELRTVIEFYDHMAGLGHHKNPETGKPWGKNDHNATINHKLLKATKALPDNKIINLEAFLRTLTDKRYEHLMSVLKP